MAMHRDGFSNILSFGKMLNRHLTNSLRLLLAYSLLFKINVPLIEVTLTLDATLIPNHSKPLFNERKQLN